MSPIPGYTPKVSLHVPAYNEPVEVVAATLRSLAQLNYSNYEVLLIDNNTPQEAAWRPLEKLCQDLGPRFRFLHLDQWPGYKSGALNFAMTQTAPDTEIIGIIDADYVVAPEFLSDMTPFFANPNVAFVQTPQDYRDYENNPYLQACHYGYKYFFAVSMPSRNEHNAIIFAGTMGLIRRTVLQEIGGWDEWCITEDAEASLRVLERGYEAIYVNKAYGTGLMPYTFDGLKKQRFRWCFGGIQILKKHWEALMPWAHLIDRENRLTAAQRYYYLVGGLQWFNEPLNLFFTLVLIVGALIHFSSAGGMLRPLTSALIVMPALFLIVGMWRFLWVLRNALHLSFGDAIRSMANFFSLSWTVTLACFQGLIQPSGVFMRTPKSQSKSDTIRAIRAAQWETVIAVTCVGLAAGVNFARPQAATLFLGGLLVWQGSLYLAAPYYSLLSMRGRRPDVAADVRGPAVQENRAARWAIALALGLLAGVVGSLLLPQPTQAPSYARLQPQDIQIGQLFGASPDAPLQPFAAAMTPNLQTQQPDPSPTISQTFIPTESPTPFSEPTSTPFTPTANTQTVSPAPTATPDATLATTLPPTATLVAPATNSPPTATAVAATSTPLATSVPPTSPPPSPASTSG